MNPISLEACRISYSYDEKKILSDLSLSFERQKLYGILGPNGCGKTTLLRHLGGILKPQAGSVLLDGSTDIAVIPRKTLAKRISFLSQHRTTPDIPVETLVGHGRFPHLGLSRKLSTRDRDIVQEAMIASGVQAFAHRSVRTLSGGERQRVYIAMLLAQNTDIVLLDEPTTYLDARHKFEVMEQLSAMRDHGKTVIAVLHDLPLALSSCDHIILLENGRCAACGTPEELFVNGNLDRVFGIHLHRTEANGKILYAEFPM